MATKRFRSLAEIIDYYSTVCDLVKGARLLVPVAPPPLTPQVRFSSLYLKKLTMLYFKLCQCQEACRKRWLIAKVSYRRQMDGQLSFSKGDAFLFEQDQDEWYWVRAWNDLEEGLVPKSLVRELVRRRSLSRSRSLVLIASPASCLLPSFELICSACLASPASALRRTFRIRSSCSATTTRTVTTMSSCKSSKRVSSKFQIHCSQLLSSLSLSLSHTHTLSSFSHIHSHSARVQLVAARTCCAQVRAVPRPLMTIRGSQLQMCCTCTHSSCSATRRCKNFASKVSTTTHFVSLGSLMIGPLCITTFVYSYYVYAIIYFEVVYY